MSQELVPNNIGTYVKAELDIQITTAKTYPRNVDKFIPEAVKLATQDEQTAEACFYCLPRKFKDSNGQWQTKEIRGASIRLAEIAASTWGNLHAATRIIENDGKFVTAEGVAWDLEKNLKIAKQVKRSITYKGGQTYSEDMQMITGNAACSIALRNAILSVLPRALIDRVYEAAVKFAIGDQKKLRDRISSLLKRFNALGIQDDKIYAFFEKKSIDEFTVNDAEVLIGVGTAIREGMVKLDDAFVLDENNIHQNVEDRLKDLLAKKGETA